MNFAVEIVLGFTLELETVSIDESSSILLATGPVHNVMSSYIKKVYIIWEHVTRNKIPIYILEKHLYVLSWLIIMHRNIFCWDLNNYLSVLFMNPIIRILLMIYFICHHCRISLLTNFVTLYIFKSFTFKNYFYYSSSHLLEWVSILD